MELERKDIQPEPTETEVRDWVLSTTRHSILMEFCLGELQLGSRDPERPHDIVGPGNKFEWPVIRGLAIENRSKVSREQFVVPALLIHRGQYHHLKWNDEHSGATEDEMLTGATDAICSLLENRSYQGGSHSFEEIKTIIDTRNPLYRKKWMTQSMDHVKKLRLPKTGQIQTLDRIPNLGLPKATHEAIVTRVRDTIAMLDQEYGYKNLNITNRTLWKPDKDLESCKSFF